MNVEDVNIVEEQKNTINELRQTMVELKEENKLLRSMLTCRELHIVDNELPKNTRISDI